MKNISIYYLFMISVFYYGCEETWESTFENFQIKKGDHGSISTVALLSENYIEFDVLFDSTAIYQLSEYDQQDINKLLGFSDCNQHHHQNSARFGWLWDGNQLLLTSYCYINGVRYSKILDTISINSIVHCKLQMTENEYQFLINNIIVDKVQRVENECNTGFYYVLWPYFGGNCTSPHDINIYIKSYNF